MEQKKLEEEKEFWQEREKEAFEVVDEWLERMAEHMEGQARSIREYKGSRVKDASRPVDPICWAVNECNNLNTNLRLDLAPRLAVDITQVQYRIKAIDDQLSWLEKQVVPDL